ncbi:MAG: hypothetical protein ACYC5H_17070 [Methylovirgula sp.]
MPATLIREEIEVLFVHAPPSEAFASIETRLSACPEADASSQRSLVLDCVETFVEDRPHEADLVAAIFAASSAYLREGQGPRAHGTPMEDRLRALIGTALKLDAPVERSAQIAALLSDLADISLLCALLHKGSGDLAPEELFGAALSDLKTRLCARVERLAAKGDIWLQAAPSAILWFWWAAQEDRVYAFVKSSMTEQRGLTALLDMVVEPSETDGAPVIAVRRWSKIVDFQSLEKQALQLALTGTSRDDRRRARRFLDAFGNGKSELFR